MVGWLRIVPRPQCIRLAGLDQATLATPWAKIGEGLTKNDPCTLHILVENACLGTVRRGTKIKGMTAALSLFVTLNPPSHDGAQTTDYVVEEDIEAGQLGYCRSNDFFSAASPASYVQWQVVANQPGYTRICAIQPRPSIGGPWLKCSQ
jgi:hypothetical protein